MAIPLDKSLLTFCEMAGYSSPADMRNDMASVRAKWAQLFGGDPGNGPEADASLAAIVARSRRMYGAQRLNDANLIRSYSYVLTRPVVASPPQAPPGPPPAPGPLAPAPGPGD